MGASAGRLCFRAASERGPLVLQVPQASWEGRRRTPAGRREGEAVVGVEEPGIAR